MLLNLQPMTSQAQRPASCRVEGCSAPHRARGLCGTHYQADRRGRGLVQAEDSRRPCSHDGCDRGFWAKGLCRLHYLWSTRGYSESCTHNGCAERTYRRNLCGKHYGNWRRFGDATLESGPCAVEGCARLRSDKVAGKLCQMHAQRARKGDIGGPEAMRAEKGAGWLRSDGYRGVVGPAEYRHQGTAGPIAEHRLIMAKAIGRPLLKVETVHHKNGDRLDNRLENLELWSSSQPPGQRVEDKLQWAREILALYGGTHSDPSH